MCKNFYKLIMLGLGLGLQKIKKSLGLSNDAVFVKRFEDRATLDGGIVEDLTCIYNKDFIKDNNWVFYYRAVDDGGVIDSEQILECVKF